MSKPDGKADPDGKAAPWTEADRATFREEDADLCDRCGEELVVGQTVVERPAFSMKFVHVLPSECDALTDGGG